MKRSFGHDWDYVERDPSDFEEDVIVATIQSPDHVAIIKVKPVNTSPFYYLGDYLRFGQSLITYYPMSTMPVFYRFIWVIIKI